MEILLGLERDSDNSYCEELKISFYSGDDKVVIELEAPGRSISVDKKQFVNMCKAFVATEGKE